MIGQSSSPFAFDAVEAGWFLAATAGLDVRAIDLGEADAAHSGELGLLAYGGLFVDIEGGVHSERELLLGTKLLDQDLVLCGVGIDRAEAKNME